MISGFDVISDLHLDPNDSFNWEGKSTSMYCIIAGNISDNTEKIRQTLLHLSSYYQAIFYIPGSLEYSNPYNIKHTNEELARVCRGIHNVIYMHNHVVVIEDCAVFGVSGWYDNRSENDDPLVEIIGQKHRLSDYDYIKNTLIRLSLHDEIKHVVIVSNNVPSRQLYFGQCPTHIEDRVDFTSALFRDSEQKVSHWIYGWDKKTADVKIGIVNYINNAYWGRRPYWPKRIEVGA